MRLRHKKHNFGPLADPFAVKISFSEESVSLAPVELEAAEKAEEATLNAAERVKLALVAQPLYPWEIAETTGLAVKTVKNTLTGLRKQGLVEPTGKTDGRAEEVRLIVPASLPYKRDEDEDDPLEAPSKVVNGEARRDVRDDLEVLTIEEVAVEMRRSGSGPAKALATYIEKPNAERLGWLACAVLRARGRNVVDWKRHTAVVEKAAADLDNHPLDCDCRGCL